MDVPLPFGFPWPTAFYLTLYVLTWAVHALLAGYVLAGSAYLLAASVFREPDAPAPLADLLRDWLPYVLSLAITAGVAPLLFAQILYRDAFYTANLLLFHRWMAILPALIVAFYGLYLLKTRWIARGPVWRRGLVAFVPLACFLFVAWSWTENHLLSRASNRWVEQYASTSLFFVSSELPARLCTWLAGTFTALACVVGWQLVVAGEREGDGSLPGSQRTAFLGLGGSVVAVPAVITYLATMPTSARAAVLGEPGLWFTVLAFVGIAAQSAGWWLQFQRGQLCRSRMAMTTGGLVATVLGTAWAREAVRLVDTDREAMIARCAEAIEIGGLFVFLIFAVVNGLLIAFCIRTVRTGWTATPTEEDSA